MNKLLLPFVGVALTAHATFIDIQNITLLSRAQTTFDLATLTAAQQVQFPDNTFRTLGGVAAVFGDPLAFTSRAQIISVLQPLEDILIWRTDTNLYGPDTQNIVAMSFHLNEPSTLTLSFLNPSLSVVNLPNGTLPIGDYQFVYSDSYNTPGDPTSGFDLTIRNNRVPEAGNTFLLLLGGLIVLIIGIRSYDPCIRSNS